MSDSSVDATGVVVVFLAATSNSLCFLLIPLAGNVEIRKTRAAVVAVSFVAGLVLQGAVMLPTVKELNGLRVGNVVGLHQSISQIAEATGLHVFGLLLVGFDGSNSTGSTSTKWWPSGQPSVFSSFWLFSSKGRDVIIRSWRSSFASYAVVTYFAPV